MTILPKPNDFLPTRTGMDYVKASLAVQISYYVSFYCPKCKSHISDVAVITDEAFDMVEAFNMVAEKNVRGSGKAIGKCNYPGTGHIIQGLTLTGTKRNRVEADPSEDD
jgi:hypothetical protein